MESVTHSDPGTSRKSARDLTANQNGSDTSTDMYENNRPQDISCGHTCKKAKPLRWGERRYYALDYYLKQNYGEKLYKISLNGGCSCPNRDGTCGTRGCIFCSEGGSGDFAASSSLSVADQLTYGKELVRPKYSGHSYIAYFQAYTNTYAPTCHLRRIFTEAISDPEVCILSIATRPDCLSPEILALLAELNTIKPVWVELGLQTIHERTATWMRRGYPLSVFENAVHALHAIGVQIITHVILFLPGESEADMLATIRYLNKLPIDGIKLQLLHVLKHTDLADIYSQEPFYVPDMDAYFHLLGKCIAALRPDIVIHRLTGDGPKSLLIAPLWTGNKRMVLNQMQRYLKEQDLWQGKEYTEVEGGIPMAEAFTLYKLIILYMLDKVDFPLTNSQISEFVLDKGYTDYFKLQQALSELTDGGLILKESTHNRTLFHLTEDGEETVHLFQDKISKPIQDDIDHFLQAKQYDLKNEVSVKADYKKNAAEEYSVQCQVFENHEPLIDLTLSVPTEKEAAAIALNWQKKNQVVYAWLMAQLL